MEWYYLEKKIWIFNYFHKFLQDNFVYATLIIGERTYEKCLCKVISKENLKVDFRNTYVRVIFLNLFPFFLNINIFNGIYVLANNRKR